MAKLPLWTPEELVAATGGKLSAPVTQPMNDVSIDSRNLKPGDVFVAIKGDTHDGHAFAANALKGGAGVAIVSSVTPEMKAAGPVLQVSGDPLQALIKLGLAARARNHGKIIGVTGSVGKTSTKEMLRSALSASGFTHASAASFNNHWGVPLTLARLPRDAAYSVFEIGMNHAGEITPLVKMVQPHIAIVTTIAASHLGHFSSLAEIARAKAEIFSGVVLGGSAIINRDAPHYQDLKSAATSCGISTVHSFGNASGADIVLKQLALHADCSCVTADILGEEVTFKLGLPGQHMAMNSLAVLAATKLCGADLARAALALSTAKPAKGRGGQEFLQAGGGDILLLDESYNANPESVAAALSLLATVAQSRKGRRIAVFGDMLELGTFGPELHKGLAKPMDAAQIDRFYAAGPLMRNLWEATPAARRARYAETSKDLVEPLLQEIGAGDSIVVKGSNGSKMAMIVEALRQKFPAVKKET